MIEVSSELIDYFGESNAPVFWLVPQVLEKKDRLGDLVRELAAKLENTSLSYDDEVPIWVTQLSNLEKEQRKIEITIQVIEDAVAIERLRLINEQFIQEKAKPYDHPDLDGITCDQYSLVELKQFDYDGPFFPGLYYKNTVFEVMPPLARAVNSMYWAHGELVKLSRKTNIKVRLDPILVHNKKTYAPVFLKMRVWGKPLDWNAISRLKQVDHSRWIPKPGWQEDVKFTDLVWIPRDDGIHFICEEVPKIEANRFRGSRYFHGIYEPQKHTFIHCDGAIRIYTRKELIERHESHLRKIGKIGKRIKTFLIEGEINTEEWTNLTCAYFVWNEDLQNYFGAGIKLHS